MDRLTLDQTGARRGQVFRHSIQMGDDTVTLENIATLTIENERFQPHRTPRNRQVLALWTGLGLISGLTFIITLAIWSGGDGGWFGAAALTVYLSFILCAASIWFGARLVLAMARWEPYYRLRIGASDGRQIDLVDDNRSVLEQIRDAIRIKIDEEDSDMQGSFDLDTDTVTLTRAGQPIA
ncbi:MAG: DUF6232 family protein [Pseudomonadota bacterium]